MLVQDWMSKNVITIGATDNMQRAIDLMMDHRISMLPVTIRGKLIGIVTDRDLRRAAPSDVAVLEVKQILYHLGRVEIQAIMSVDLVTVPQEFTIDETAQVLLKHKISGCPVVDDTGALVGVITRNDLFKAMISASGAPHLGIQFGFLLEDRVGSLQEILDVIRDYDARLLSIMCTYDHAPSGYRFTYIRVFSVNRDRLTELKEELKKKAEILYIVDHREKTREVYSAPMNSDRPVPEMRKL